MRNILFTLLLLISFSSFGQINIEKPSGWVDLNSENSIAENLKRAQLGNYEDLLNDMEIKQSTVLYMFTKYDIKTYAGISPTINAMLLRNINGFSLKDMSNQGELMMQQLRNSGMEEVFLESTNIVKLN